MQAVYAFCREIDDIGDELPCKILAAHRLHFWEEELDRVFYKGIPRHPIGEALQQILEDFPLPKQPFDDLIKGMRMDLTPARYATFEALRAYCYCAASTVGLLVVTILGARDPATLKYAEFLGISLQLINIIRDIFEDAEQGKIYLPEEELTQFSVTHQELTAHPPSENLKKLLRFQIARAKHYYQEAYKILPALDRPNQSISLVIGEIYSKLLEKIEASLNRPVSQYSRKGRKIKLTFVEKLWIVWQTSGIL